MKFKFETGEVIECFDETIAKLLRVDERYKEVKDETPKSKSKKVEEVKDETPKGDESNDEIQE